MTTATTTDPITALLAKLEGVKKTPTGWQARCPAHEDRHASLSISEGRDGNAVIFCHARCETKAIVAALGLKMSDLFPARSSVANGNGRRGNNGSKAPRQIVATYDYRDEEGQVVCQAVRTDPKGFFQRRPDGNGGWINDLKDVRRVLYRLPELLNAREDRPDEWRFVVEGEKDVERLTSLGLIATTNIGGAGKWRDEYSSALDGCRVAVIVDNDDAGRAHGRQVGTALAGKAVDVRMIELPDLPPKGDVSDWLNAGGTREKLIAIVDRTSTYTSTLDPSAPAEQNLPVWCPLRLTQQINAQRLVQRLNRNARYHAEKAGWLVYREDEGRFVDDLSGHVVRESKAVAAELWSMLKNPPPGIERDSLFRHGRDSEKASSIDAAIRLARTEPGVTAAAAEFDRDQRALNLLNGVLDLRTFQLRPHSREDLHLKLAPVRFDPSAKCPLWDSVLNRVMAGNETMIAYLARIAGLCLTGDATVQELFIFHGPGANGKSVVLDTWSGIMGDYAGEAAPNLLTVKSKDDHPCEVMDLEGKRLVVASETEQGAKLKVQFVKRVTGNARLKGRRMFQNFTEFDRTHKLILATNSPPVILEATNAVWRRVRLVPFNVTIPKDEQDPNLLAKLKNEWPGILNWCIRGCRDWQQNGMQTPQEVCLATDQYQADQDPIGDYIAERTVSGEGLKATRNELYSDYQSYCSQTGDKQPLDRTTFLERVRHVSGVIDKQWKPTGLTVPVRGFFGIGLKPVAWMNSGSR